MSLLDELGLGEEYSKKNKEGGLGQFTSKPSPKPYQPFGGQLQREKPLTTEEFFNPYNEVAPQKRYESPLTDDLDIYDELQAQRKILGEEYNAHNKSANLYESRFKDFVENKLDAFYKTHDEFDTPKDPDEYITRLDEMYKDTLRRSKEKDGFTGPSESKIAATNHLKNFIGYNQPNGLRDQFLRLKKEKESRRKMADDTRAREVRAIDQLTKIPLVERRQLAEDSRIRKKKDIGEKEFNKLLDSQSWQTPIVGMDGYVPNLYRTDPRNNKFLTGAAKDEQARRLSIAKKGELDAILKQRDYTKKERSLRDRGILVSRDGLLDGYPIGMSRRDVDILDIDKMRKAGMTEYNGRPLEEVLNELGGEERVKLAKVMEAVYTAQNNYTDAQFAFFANSGSVKSKKMRQKMDAARESRDKAIQLAASFGLDNELFEQAGTTSWLAGLGNAISRGMLMSEMSNYTPDFLTNTLNADEIEDFIDIASQIEDLPGSSALQRYQNTKSEGFLDALQNLLFNNTAAIPELFAESMMSFLPATFKWGLASAGVGAVTNGIRGLRGGAPGVAAGALAGGSMGLRAGWGVASFTLEMAGEVQRAMSELGIDWKNPQIFAAAFNNEITRQAIVKKAAKKASMVGLFDLASASLAGKLTGLRQLGLNGGKLIDGASWAENLKYASASAPRFTKFQKGANIATEVAADSLLGGAGEFFGQAWSKEPGEAWDWDAVAAENIIGIGPGFAGAFIQSRTQAADDFSDAPIQYSDIQSNPGGQTGRINRAGFVREFQTFNSAEGMATAILNRAGIDDSNARDIESGRKSAMVFDWVSRMYMANPQQMANLRVVFTDRTPLPNKGDYEGSFERDADGNGVMYMKASDMKRDPIGTFFHELGHLARHTIFEKDTDLIDIYESLTADEKMQAFTEYFKKIPGKALSQYSENEQKQIRKAYKQYSKKGTMALADEWFSYQFVRMLAGGKVDTSVRSDMQSWLNKFAYPFLKEFVGSEKAAGNQKEVLDARILSYLNRTPRGFATTQQQGPAQEDAPRTNQPDVEPETEVNFNAPGVRAPAGVNVLAGLNDSEGLNFLIGRIMDGYVTAEERRQMARDFNEFMGKNILDTNLSFWTTRQAEDLALEKDVSTVEGQKEVTRARKMTEMVARAKVSKVVEDKKENTEVYGKDGKVSKPKKPSYEQQQYKKGNRFKVVMTMPGFNDTGSKVQYFKDENSANEAKRKFEEENNIKRIARIKKRLQQNKALLTKEKSFNKAIEKAEKDLLAEIQTENARIAQLNKEAGPEGRQLRLIPEEISINAIVAKAFDLEGMMNDGLFGASYIANNLVEPKQRLIKGDPDTDPLGYGGKSRDTAFKPPSMEEIKEAIFKADEQLDDAYDMLEQQEDSLVREIQSLTKAMNKARGMRESKLPKDQKTPKEKQRRSGKIESKVRGLVSIQKELAEAEASLKAVREFKDVLIPEQMSVDWADTEHPNLVKLVDGKKVPVTFGDLAQNTQSQTFFVKKIKNGKPDYNTAKEISDPQKTLLQFAESFNRKDFEKQVKYTNVKNIDEYALRVDAVLASVMNRNDFMSEPMGEMKIGEGKDKKQEEKARDNTLGGFQTDKGTNYLAVAIDRLVRKQEASFRSAKDKKGVKIRKLQSSNPSLVESAVQEVAKGALFENRNAASENRAAYRYISLLNTRIQADLKTLSNIEKKLRNSKKLTSQETKSLESQKDFLENRIKVLIVDVDDIGDYAEEQDYFPKLKGGNDKTKQMYSFNYAFSNYLYLRQVQDNIQKYLEHEYFKIPAMDGVTRRDDSKVGSQEAIKGPGGTYDGPTGEYRQYKDLKSWLENQASKYRMQAAKAEVEKENKKLSEKSVFSDFEGLDLSPQADEIEDFYMAGPEGPSMPAARVQEVVEKDEEGKLRTSEKRTPINTAYNYREIGTEDNDKISARDGVHGGFKRGVVDLPINLMKLLGVKDIESVMVPGRFDSSSLVELVRPELGTVVEVEYTDDQAKTPGASAKKKKFKWHRDGFGKEGWHHLNNSKPKLEIKSPSGTTRTKLAQAIDDAWMSEVDKRLKSGQQDLNSVTLAEIAEFLYRQGGKVQDLTMLPSSSFKNKTRSEKTGAPGGGLLLFTYNSFLKEAYKLLNIKQDIDTEITESAKSIPTFDRPITYDNEPAKIIIDANGGFGIYRVDEFFNDPKMIQGISRKDFDKIVESKFASSRKEIVSKLKEQLNEGAEVETKTAERQFKRVTLKYITDRWFVTQKIPDPEGKKNEDGSIKEITVSKSELVDFGETDQRPTHDYLVKTLAPIMQAVIDARRIDLYKESKADDKKVYPGDPNREDTSFDEELRANTETETDVTKDQAKTDADDFEESADADINVDKTLDQTTLTAGDRIMEKLGSTKNRKSPLPRLFQLKKEGPLEINDLVRKFQNDKQLWKAFGFPNPPQAKFLQNLSGNKPDALYRYVETIKKHKNWPLFEARILKGGTQTLGSGYVLSSSVPDTLGRIGFLSRMAGKVMSEEDREKYLKMLDNYDLKTALVDQADPAKVVATKFLEISGLKDKNLMEKIDIHGLWHQYYGKGQDLYEKAQNNFINPIKDALIKHNVDYALFGEYLLARAAPSRNLHLRKVWEDYANTFEGEKRDEILAFVEKRKNDLSGINTDDAIARLKELEADPNLAAFIKDESNPLQLFYDMNKEALRFKRESGLIQSDTTADEYKAMVKAMSQHKWTDSIANLKDDYAYAPMQGFEGETETLFDNEQSYEAVGKQSGAAGRGWDQPKQMLLQQGAFGRMRNIGPDPQTVFATAQQQYFNSAIQSSKNEVSNSLGTLFEFMRAIAYPDNESNIDLPKELKDLPEETRAEIKKEFDKYFEVEFQKSKIEAAYEYKELDYEIGGQKVEGLRMVRRELSKEFQNDPLVFVYRKFGTPQFIKFKSNQDGARLAASMKNLRYQALPSLLRGFNTITRWMAQAFTSLNPAFIIPNFIRDWFTAAIHLSEMDKKDILKDALFDHKQLRGAFKAILKSQLSIRKGDKIPVDIKLEDAEKIVASGDYERIYQLFKKAGGKIGYFRHKSIPELITDLRELKTPKNRNFVRKSMDFIDDANTAVENTLRVSAFAAAIKNGRSAHEAATISRNVTVDFNQKGNLTQAFGALFMFFGANVNSAHRLIRSLKNRPEKEAATLIGGMISASMLVSLFNRLLDDDDEEAVPDYDTINPFVRDSNFIVPLPGNFQDPTGGDTGYFKVPLPLGYNIFWGLGQSAMDVFWGLGSERGGSGVFDFATRNISNFFNGFNPIGGASISTAVTPSFAQPIIELISNKNFMGSEIRKDKRAYETTKPAHMYDPRRTSDHFRDLSKTINEFAGGTDALQGSLKGIFTGNPLAEQDDIKWNWSGGEIEHLLLGYTGGPGAILNTVFGKAVYPMFPQNDSTFQLTVNNTPILNRFLRTSTYGTTTRKMYYNLRDTINQARAEVDLAKKRDPIAGRAAAEKFKKLTSLHPQIKYLDGVKKKIRNKIQTLEKGNLSTSEKTQRIEELQQKELNMLSKLITKAQKLDLI